MFSKFFKYLLLVLIAVLIAVTALFCVSQFLILNSAEGKIFSVAEAPSEKVVIVLGASVFGSGQPSDMLADRLLTAIDLYEVGKVEKFLLSGDHGQTDYNEVEAMREYLLEKGIPETNIFLDHAGFDTYDSMVRAHEVFQLDSCLVVSQSYHLPRAIFIGESQEMEVYGVSADRQTYVKISYFKFRESLARIKAVLDVFLKAEPKYLGEPIPIESDKL